MVDASDPAAAIASRCFALRVRALDRKLSRIYDDELREFGITVAQLNLLVAISMAAPVTPGVLAAALELEKSSLSRTVAKMVARQWVRSETTASAGLELSVTGKGRRMLAKVQPAWERAQRKARRTMNTRFAADLAGLPPKFS